MASLMHSGARAAVRNCMIASMHIVQGSRDSPRESQKSVFHVQSARRSRTIRVYLLTLYIGTLHIGVEYLLPYASTLARAT